jgi:hypothetical protein
LLATARSVEAAMGQEFRVFLHNFLSLAFS